MAILGARSLLDLALPTGIDGAEVLRFQLESGVTAAEAIALAASTIGTVNESILTKYGDMLHITESPYARTRQGEGSRSETPDRADFEETMAVHSDHIGNMLPRKDHRDALAWTPLYMRRAMNGQLEDDIALIAERWTNKVERELLTRALTNTENAIGSAGYDVGWAIGTGTNVDFIPPQFGATVFTSSHSHYVFANDTNVDYDSLFEDMITQLRHHGYTGRLAALVSSADLSEIAAVDGFVELNPQGVTVVEGDASRVLRIAEGEFEAMPGELFGFYKSLRGLVELRYSDRIPTNYAFMTKPFGRDNRNNGLAVRTEPGVGFGLMVNPQLTRSINPELDKVYFDATHGVGVNNRLNGVAGYIAAGASAYVNPTIS